MTFLQPQGPSFKSAPHCAIFFADKSRRYGKPNVFRHQVINQQTHIFNLHIQIVKVLVLYFREQNVMDRHRCMAHQRLTAQCTLRCIIKRRLCFESNDTGFVKNLTDNMNRCGNGFIRRASVLLMK